MQTLNIPQKVTGDTVTAADINAMVGVINQKPDIARKAFRVALLSDGSTLTHNFGTRLGLAMEDFHVQIEGEGSDHSILTGTIGFTPLTANSGKVNFLSDTTVTLDFPIIVLTATPF